ncbi:conserved hypothetical protein [Desulfosarcina cetonica]|uniref:IMPACT family protein n=1 Tax=Desulfosarcina cetonica TaxID=90730 RepID=UPI0006D0BEE6|nr:YigZ family protein [Desulfosarcina cetonica]VTR65813.1 conserved hypothetical protein [Desulfosarcina cetonica]
MLTLTKAAHYEEEIKKSRFIVRATPVDRPEAAMAFLESIREERATHHCWAFRIDPRYRFSDDGEPGGTAGRPILNAIERQDIDRVMVVVIRYYGGIKLGAGGLARAYGGCAAKCLQAATLVPVVVRATMRLTAGFAHVGAIYPLIEQFGAQKTAEAYTPDGLTIDLRVDQEMCSSLATALKDASGGQIGIVVEEDSAAAR